MFNVDNAVILAAGFGSRFVPITYELPKGLVPVRGEPLLERQIRQLQEKGINDIIIAVGYLKEKFDYLIDKFGVRLVYNPEYAVKNNLASLYYVRAYLKNSYILSADNWMDTNIFNAAEEKSWYSCVFKNGPTSEWCVTTDTAGRINGVTIGGRDSWVMYGPVFLSEPFSQKFIGKIEEYNDMPGKEQYMWENVFIDEIDHFDLFINKQSEDNVYEFETLEELRRFDPDSCGNTQNALIKTITNVFGAAEHDIVDIQNLKAGMTNRSFSFSLRGNSYIFRLPGEGTGKLINRKQEAEVYKAIKQLAVSDEIIHFDANTGYKISVFYKDAQNTSQYDSGHVRLSMEMLRRIHCSGIKVAHSFAIDREISRYNALCRENNAMRFTDNESTRIKMNILIEYIKSLDIPEVLCHVDSNPDNFIRLADGSFRLVDWEYSGMGDPVMDISMYAIYSYFSKEETDELLAVYLARRPVKEETARLYAYCALGGYLWALWTEYKQSLGVEFGEYGMKMYRYAKEYFKRFQDLFSPQINN